jgi:nucleotide-binding universal stress UspA family protein
MVADEPGADTSVWTIVVGVDDSDGAARALGWADALLRRRLDAGANGRGVAVAAWRQPAFDLLGGLADLDALEEATSVLLDRALAELDDPARFEPAVRLGAAADVLLAEAGRQEADLIVVGTRGRGALAEVLLGSVSRSVASRAEYPVAIVPASDGRGEGPAVVGYDGSPGGRAALAWAVDNIDGPIEVVSAWHLPTEAIYDPVAVDVDRFEAQIRAELERAVDDLAAARPDLDLADRVTTVVQRDDPRLSLVEASKDAACIVLGARSHRGVSGLLLGSTVDYVASHAHQAVIIVPPGDEGADHG